MSVTGYLRDLLFGGTDQVSPRVTVTNEGLIPQGLQDPLSGFNSAVANLVGGARTTLQNMIGGFRKPQPQVTSTPTPTVNPVTARTPTASVPKLSVPPTLNADHAPLGSLPAGYDYAPELRGFTGTTPPDYLSTLIASAASERRIDPALLAAVLFQESRFNPQTVGDTDPNDRGLAQINRLAYPQVTDQQAYNPEFAVNFAARKLAEDFQALQDLSDAVAAYNVGRNGAKLRGPRGQTYINNVARNLSPDLIQLLGLRVTPDMIGGR